MERFFLIVFGLFSAWLLWQGYRHRKGIRRFTRVLHSNPAPNPRALGLEIQPALLRELGQAVVDVTTEATLGRELEKNQRRFIEALLNEIEDGLMIIDENQEVRFANRAAAILCPGSQPQVGRPLIEVCLDHRIVETVLIANEIGAKTQEQLVMNLRSSPREGERTERIFLIEAEPLNPDLNLGAGTWMIIRDISLQKETEQIRRDFIANASHELRTPLSIIGGYLEMLSEERELDEDTVSRAVATMRKHSDRITRIVEDMLTISKLERESDMLTHEYFDLADCVFDCIEHLRPLIDEKGAHVMVDFPEGDRSFYGDRFYWDQVFFNLIENALKQNGRGVDIEIRLNASDRGRYRIEVADNGVGIPGPDLPHIFKRFYRVEKHHSKEIKGTGLGLSIVRRAVEAHKGTISVRSKPGIETVFTIEVPRPTVHAEAPHPQRH